MARLAFPPFLRVFKDGGDVCPDATATWYLAGTTTLTDTYTSSALSAPNTNPVAANSLGTFPAMWLADGVQYKIKIQGTGVTTQTIDEVYSTASLDQLSGDRRYLGLAGGAAFVTTGSSNAYVVTTGLSTTSLSTYETLLIKANFTNTGPATLNIDGLGAKNIYSNGASLSAGDLASGRIYPVCYDGSQFQLLSSATADATLTALAALTIAAGSRIFGSGSDTFTSSNEIGMVSPFAGRAAPTGWLLCYGQAVSRSTYAGLFAVLCPSLGNFTVTIASPGVFTLAGHGLSVGDRIRLTTTGALPTGLAAATDYYVSSVPSADTLQLSATLGGSAINTSGSQSGTHSAQFFGHGAGDGSTTFNLPDMRGRGVFGRDDMGGTAASRVTRAVSGVEARALGAVGGDQLLHAHSHGVTDPTHAHISESATVYSSGTAAIRNTGGYTTGQRNASGTLYTENAATGVTINNAGTGAAQNMPPATVLNYIIFAAA